MRRGRYFQCAADACLRREDDCQGSAALALAGFMKVLQQLAGQTSVILLCGGNIGHEVVKRFMCDH